LSEVHRHVVSITMAVAILSMLAAVTFTLAVYTDAVACQKLCEIVRSRLTEIVMYAYFERNVTVRLSLSDLASRCVELYVVNSTCIEVRVPLRYFRGVVAKGYVTLPEGAVIDYSGLLPRDFYLVFSEEGGKVVIRVRP